MNVLFTKTAEAETENLSRDQKGSLMQLIREFQELSAYPRMNALFKGDIKISDMTYARTFKSGITIFYSIDRQNESEPTIIIMTIQNKKN